ncbi:NADH-quinone oxidoreductase subunit NuoE [Buchnera aphidicola (Mollitrichosiphum nigrofasciatum)]
MNINKVKEFYKNPRAASIEALKIVQKKRNWISQNAIIAIAKFLDISSTDLEGVATFYSGIFRQPVGRYIIQYCNSVVCFTTGYKNVKKSLEKKLNIKPGQTTVDKKFTLLSTCCLGYCDQGPVISINKKIYKKLNYSIIPLIIESYNDIKKN